MSVYAQYAEAFAALYPQYGTPPLEEKFGITRKRAQVIAAKLKVRRLPRDERHCFDCPTPLKGVPSWSGNYCKPCHHKRRTTKEKEPVRHIRLLFHRAKVRSKKKGVEFDLTQEHLLDLWRKQERKCFYSNLPMKTDGRARDPMNASLDRVHPEKGYTIGNVVLCCWGVNTAKQEFSLAEFVKLCRSVAENVKLDEIVREFGDGGRGKSPVVPSL